MAEEVKVIVGADTKQLTSELDKANKAIKNFGSTVQTGANKAGLALNDLSRIAQDAPYGFIGISNNINPLIESFGRLKAETGSTGSALKALVSGLSGPAGVGLAFGVLSAAISFASVGLTRWVKTTHDSNDAANSFNTTLLQSKKIIDDVKDSFDAFKYSQESALQLWGSFAELQLGKGIEADLTKSRMEFIQIGEAIVEQESDVEKLRRNYENATKAFRLFTQSQKGTFDEYGISKFDKRISELVNTFGSLENVQTSAIKGFTDEQQTAITAIIESYKALNDAEVNLQKLQNQRGIKAVQNQVLTSEANKKEQEALKKTGETIDEIIAKFRRKLTFEETLGLPPMEELKAKINDFEAVLKKLIVDKKVSPTSNIILNLQAELGVLQDDLLYQQIGKRMLESRQTIKLLNPFEFVYTAEQQAIIDRYQQKLANESKKAALREAELGGMKLNIPVKPKIDFSGIQGAVDKDLVDLGKTLQTSFSQLGADVATTIAEGIGNMISGKDNALKGMLDGIALILSEAMISIGKQIIVLATALDAVYKSLMSNPITALLAGIALVALGTAAKNALSSKDAFATGTTFAPGGMALVGERGPELVSLPQGSKVIPNGKTNSMMQGALQAVEVYGTLRGQDIYSSNKKYGLTYNRLV